MLLAVTTSSATAFQGDRSNPEALLLEFVEARWSQDWDRCIALTHPGELARVKDAVLHAFSNRPDAAVVRGVLNKANAPSLEAAEPEGLYRFFLDLTASYAQVHVTQDARPIIEIIDVLDDGDRLLIVHRVSVEIGNKEFEVVDVIPVAQHQGRWYVSVLREANKIIASWLLKPSS